MHIPVTWSDVSCCQPTRSELTDIFQVAYDQTEVVCLRLMSYEFVSWLSEMWRQLVVAIGTTRTEYLPSEHTAEVHS